LSNLTVFRREAAHSLSATIKTNPADIYNKMKKIFPILKKIEQSAREYRNTYLMR
jgi:hypothetical protein